MISEDDILRICQTLPEAIQNGSGFEVRGKGFAWYYQEKIEGRKGRVERKDVLAVRVANESEKQILLAADPEKFFTTAHYNGYPAILVQLTAIETDELAELLTDAWRIRAPRKLVAEFDARVDG
jgi:hypothetical protein